MDKYLDEEELHKMAEDKHITAVELNLLVTATKEASALRQQQLDKLNSTLEKLEKRLNAEGADSTKA